MGRYAFLMQCKKGEEEEYKRRHENVYPELLKALKETGVSNYSIFMDGNHLYAFMEVDDFDEAMGSLENHPANIKWQEFMSDILVMDETGNPKMHVIKDEVFFLK
ncbi:L-rhamnose mutarotase [Pseudalkalibacillus salsuginis]|uniref:L-rhamnose mutarotase n=1 Tax=Pseudalkalibacillus salsuginis TaxID=2910972 RepID=UPI001F3C8CC5|nr:L-rhamnose mutarotase [Pseudalkalibacillus salsuginis]MCF6411396.1 L-rhamnose mutarotase [Pseudalkalibacillus salsuginis]